MTAIRLDGKAAAERVLVDVAARALALADRGTPPGLATVLVGDDPASGVYVAQKIKACGAAGLVSVHVALPGHTTQHELHARLGELNRDRRVHGVIVQLPLPAHLEAGPALRALDPAKDADGLHPANQGRWMAHKSWRDVTADGVPLPCTPAGVMELLQQNNIPLAWKRAVVLGRSSLVGKPMALFLLAADATVTMAHSRTEHVEDLCRSADILVAAMGRPRCVRGDWIKPGAVVVDVGISRTPQGLVGDVEPESVRERASYLSPVPGGVGPLTVALLLRNTVAAAERQVS